MCRLPIIPCERVAFICQLTNINILSKLRPNKKHLEIITIWNACKWKLQHKWDLCKISQRKHICRWLYWQATKQNSCCVHSHQHSMVSSVCTYICTMPFQHTEAPKHQIRISSICDKGRSRQKGASTVPIVSKSTNYNELVHACLDAYLNRLADK